MCGHGDLDADWLAVGSFVHQQSSACLFDMIALVARRARKVEVGRQWMSAAKGHFEVRRSHGFTFSLDRQ